MKLSWFVSSVLIGVLGCACSDSPETVADVSVTENTAIENTPVEDIPAREKYNMALHWLQQGEYDQAIEYFLSARDSAKIDQQLRRDAAYNLALGYAQKASSLEESDAKTAYETYDHAISWFQDAIRLDGKAEDARQNLEVSMRRKMRLADQLSQGENSLEKRLERLLSDVVMIEKNLQQMIWMIDQDPSAKAQYAGQADKLEVQLRTLQADASTIYRLAGDEQQSLSYVLEEERTPEQQTRMYLLELFTQYFVQALDSLGQARYDMRSSDAQKSLGDLDVASEDILRSIEQLLPPPQVLQNLTQEHNALLQQMMLLEKSTGTSLFSSDVSSEVPPLPSWFTASWLQTEHEQLRDRVKELKDKIAEYAMYASQESSEAEDAKAQYTKIAYNSVPPLLNSAEQSLHQAEEKLANSKIIEAIQADIFVNNALMQALEYFADIKHIVEQSYQTHTALEALIAPDTEGMNTASLTETMVDFTKNLTQNITRLQNLQLLLEIDKQETLSKEQDPEKSEQIQAMYTKAEELRSQALQVVQQSKILAEDPSTNIGSMREELAKADDALYDLRILFFTIIEHLQETARQQEELLQQTTVQSGQEYSQFVSEIPLIGYQQQELAAKTNIISQELQKMADTLATQGDMQKSEAFGDAFVETGLAEKFMQDVVEEAQDMLVDTSVSHDPTEIISNQTQALEALMRALQALQPPQQGDNQDDTEQQEQDMNQQQAQQKMQRAQEKEAQREKNKQVVQSGQTVDKDW